MTRKLFSLTLSAFALLLLMGAGVEQDPAAEPQTEKGTRGAQLVETSETHDQEADQAHTVTAVAGSSVLTLVEDMDRTLTVDGKPVSSEVNKTQRSGTTYVALAPMVAELDPSAAVSWDGSSGTVTVNSSKLNLSATVGQLYVVANGRYLYLPEGVQVVNGRVTVPLSVLMEAFDASMTWNAATGVVAVTRGSGALTPADQYYNQNDLFWLSRIIYAESGNQPLEGMMAVGNVVLNRVNDPIYPNTIVDVLAQKNQFTTYQSGKLANRTPNTNSVIAAKLVLDGGVVEETLGATHFDSTGNSWASRHKTCVAVIGAHYFYA